MIDEEDYVDVDAVVRMRKDARLADSKKTDGWSRGFTPNSSSAGPEHVEIRLKDHGETEASSTTPTNPDFTPFDEYGEPPRQKTREQEDLEEALGLLVILGLFKAAEWAQPRLQRLWSEHVIAFFIGKRDRWRERRVRRMAGSQTTLQASASDVPATHVDGTNGVSDALEAYEATMTSAEARQHFTEALVAQHFTNMKMRLLAQARIEDGGLSPKIADVIQALTPAQVEKALNSMLTSKPTLPDDLGTFLQVNRDHGQLQLGSDKMKAARRLTGKGFTAEP